MFHFRIPSARYLLLAASLSLCCLSPIGRANALTQEAARVSGGMVRVAYIIPSDRQPIDNFRMNAGHLLNWIQQFYADQMERHGFGRMTFNYEHASDGLPVVHLIRSPLTAKVFADAGHTRYSGGKYVDHALEAVRGAGYNPDKQDEIWLNIVEAQDQLPDGSIHNSTAQGSGGYCNGSALVSGNVLALANAALVKDLRPYGGLTLPELGPYPLVMHESFPDYDGDFVSSIACDAIGAVAHELGHCFTLSHCYLNDYSANGNLMGNGFRGWRGNMMPDLCSDEESRLDRPSALILRLNPFFRKSGDFVVSPSPPTLQIETQPGAMKLDSGMFHVTFKAAQPNAAGIALVVLMNGSGRDGVGTVAYKEYDGSKREVSDTISTSLIAPGREDTWILRVYDSGGNFAEKALKMTAPPGGSGPQLFISVPHTTVRVGEPIPFHVFHDLLSVPQKQKFHWSFGDGGESEETAVTHTYSHAGSYEVKLEGTDENGYRAEISQFVLVRKSSAVRTKDLPAARPPRSSQLCLGPW